MGPDEIIEFVSGALLASVKFAFAPSTLIIVLQKTILFAIGSTLTGAYIGALTFFYGGKGIIAAWTKLFPRKKEKRIFTKGNRRIIRVRQKFGLWGLCFSAVILSIPVVSILLAKFYKNDKRTIPYFMIALTLWTIVLTLFSYIFQEPLAPYFK